jgi:hypothetical protein
VIGQQTVRTNKDGKFSTYAQTWLPGKVTITARGLRSGKTGSGHGERGPARLRQRMGRRLVGRR